jgi:RNase P/RNase MRP subunit POP5
LLHLFELIRHIKREYKYSIGDCLRNETLELLTLIFRANSRSDKEGILQTAREHVEVIRLFIRALFDMKQINLKQFVSVNQKIEEISKQLTAWQKVSKR